MIAAEPNWLLIGGGILVLGLLVWFLVKWGLRRLKRAVLINKYENLEFVNSIMDGHIMRGMSMDMVIDVWGDPVDLDETALKTKTKQEMKYDQKGKNRFGTRVYLEDGLVVGWETK